MMRMSLRYTGFPEMSPKGRFAIDSATAAVFLAHRPWSGDDAGKVPTSVCHAELLTAVRQVDSASVGQAGRDKKLFPPLIATRSRNEFGMTYVGDNQMREVSLMYSSHSGDDAGKVPATTRHAELLTAVRQVDSASAGQAGRNNKMFPPLIATRSRNEFGMTYMGDNQMREVSLMYSSHSGDDAWKVPTSVCHAELLTAVRQVDSASAGQAGRNNKMFPPLIATRSRNEFGMTYMGDNQMREVSLMYSSHSGDDVGKVPATVRHAELLTTVRQVDSASVRQAGRNNKLFPPLVATRSRIKFGMTYVGDNQMERKIIRSY